MLVFSSIFHEKNDIYLSDDFEVNGVYQLETNKEDEYNFRWSNYHLSVTAKQPDIQGFVITFFNLFDCRKVFIFTHGHRKEFTLLYGESSIFVPIMTFEKTDIIIQPTGTLSSEDVRSNLGLIVKKIFRYQGKEKFARKLNSISKYSELISHKNFRLINVYKYVDIPFESQTGSLEFYDIKTEGREYYFNPCIFQYKNNDYLICRKTQVLPDYNFLTTLKSFSLPNLEPFEIEIKKEEPEEQLEDPRIFFYKDKILISAVSYTNFRKDFFHQKIMVYDKDFNFEKNIHPVYGNNGEAITKNIGNEKNWSFFESDGKLYFVYQMFPHTVVETDLNGRIITEYKTHKFNSSFWKYGEPRLSLNPVYKDGCFHSFFHSHLTILDENGCPNRIYFAGYYTFQAEPPFEILEVKDTPILWGNKHRKMKEKDNPYCVFPCGVIVKDDQFHISFGINDEECALLKFTP